jgi:Secretion system C-terminal sorting domain
MSIFFVDITGRTIFKEELSVAEANNTHIISTSSFARGIYFVKLFTAEGSAVKKVVIE